MADAVVPVLSGHSLLFGLGLMTLVLLAILVAVLWRESTEPRTSVARPRLWALALQEEEQREREVLQARIVVAEISELLSRTPGQTLTTEQLAAAVGQPRRAVVIALQRLQRAQQVESVPAVPPLENDGWRRRPDSLTKSTSTVREAPQDYPGADPAASPEPSRPG